VLTFARYLAFQVPTWGIALVVAWGLDLWTELPSGLIGVGLAVVVVKDFVIYPFVRSAYEHRPHDAGHTLVGMKGRVVVALDPEGWVEVGHERWRARSGEQVAAPLDVGSKIRVDGLQGHTLLVHAEGSTDHSM